MPEIVIPFVEVNSQRNPDAYNNSSKDARAVNCVYKLAPNPITREMEVWCEKRAGLEVISNLDGTNIGHAIRGSYTASASAVTTARYSVFRSAAGSGRVFSGTTLLGTTDSLTGGMGPVHITQAVVGGVLHVFFGMPPLNTDSIEAYYYDTSVSTGTTTFTADTTSGNPTLANVSSTANLREGQKLSGTGIAAGARIASGGISGTNVTMTANATANGSTITITQEHLSKFMSANFPARSVGPILNMDGYNVTLDFANNRLYNSNSNSVTTWGASDYLALSDIPDNPISMQKIGKTIYTFGASAISQFTNNGNPTGSVFSRSGGISEMGVPIVSFSPCVVLDNVLYFISSRGGIFALSGEGMKRISNDFLDALMASSQASTLNIGSSAGCAYLDAFYYGGKPYLMLGGINWENLLFTTFTARYQFWYDVKDNAWSEQDFTISSTARCMRFNSNAAMRSVDAIAVAPLGTTYQLDLNSPVYTDAGSTMTMTLQTNKKDLGRGKRVSFFDASLIGDEQASGTATLSYSDDDYANWTTAGTFDLTDLTQKIHRLGSSKFPRAWRLQDSNNQAARYQGLRLRYEVGSH